MAQRSPSRSAAVALCLCVCWLLANFAEQSYVGASRRGQPPATEFGDFTLHGAAARWLLDQNRALKKELKPTPIQARSFLSIREGNSVALSSPTGTGKTLAYLLPLWERLVEAEKARVEGPRVLIIAPSIDLQLQIGSVATELAREASSEELVLVLRRNTVQLQQKLLKAAVVIATPAMMMEFCDISTLIDSWLHAAAGLRALVVDEVDCMLPPGGATSNELGDVLELIMGASGGPPEERPGGPLQMVLASASIDPWTLAYFQEATRAEIEFIHVGPWDITEAISREDAEEVGPVETNLLGLEEVLPRHMAHSVTIVEEVLDSNGQVHPDVMPFISKVIYSLQVGRSLVVLAERRGVSETGHTSKKYLWRLRHFLAPLGYTVITASAFVELLNEGHGNDFPKKQVVLGRSEAIRGLDLPGVEAVVVVGGVANAREYLHITGRTARWDMELGAPAAGTVVSVVDKRMATSIKTWAKELGFELEPFDLEPMPKDWSPELPPNLMARMPRKRPGGRGRRRQY